MYYYSHVCANKYRHKILIYLNKSENEAEEKPILSTANHVCLQGPC